MQSPGFALTARYFFLSCQEEVPKKKSRPLRRPATPGALRCSVTTGAAQLAPAGLRQCSPFFRCALSVAKKYSWGAPCAARRRRGQDQHRPQFFAQEVELKRHSPCGAPSNAGKPGEVGEHCLRGAAPSCAAARLDESRREVGAADRGAGVAFSFATFFWRSKRKYARASGAEHSVSEQENAGNYPHSSALRWVFRSDLPRRRQTKQFSAAPVPAPAP